MDEGLYVLKGSGFCTGVQDLGLRSSDQQGLQFCGLWITDFAQIRRRFSYVRLGGSQEITLQLSLARNVRRWATKTVIQQKQLYECLKWVDWQHAQLIMTTQLHAVCFLTQIAHQFPLKRSQRSNPTLATVSVQDVRVCNFVIASWGLKVQFSAEAYLGSGGRAYSSSRKVGTSLSSWP